MLKPSRNTLNDVSTVKKLPRFMLPSKYEKCGVFTFGNTVLREKVKAL